MLRNTQIYQVLADYPEMKMGNTMSLLALRNGFSLLRISDLLSCATLSVPMAGLQNTLIP
jgi:hypothetical protein